MVIVVLSSLALIPMLDTEGAPEENVANWTFMIYLDSDNNLESAGIEIIVCGTCLNFFELGGSLEVGRVTDMLEIASRLAEAGSIVRP